MTIVVVIIGIVVHQPVEAIIFLGAILAIIVTWALYPVLSASKMALEVNIALDTDPMGIRIPLVLFQCSSVREATIASLTVEHFEYEREVNMRGTALIVLYSPGRPGLGRSV